MHGRGRVCFHQVSFYGYHGPGIVAPELLDNRCAACSNVSIWGSLTHRIILCFRILLTTNQLEFATGVKQVLKLNKTQIGDGEDEPCNKSHTGL